VDIPGEYEREKEYFENDIIFPQREKAGFME